MAAVPPDAAPSARSATLATSARRTHRTHRIRRADRRSAPAVLAAASLVGLLAAGCSGGTHPAAATTRTAQTTAPGSTSTSPATTATTATTAASDAPGKPAAPNPDAAYVALGDSYVAGPGIPTPVGTPAGCLRSDHAYPALVAQALGIPADDARSVACIGATNADMTATQHMNGGNPPQLDALGPATRLVTLGIGGNDVDVVGVVIKCLTLDTPANTWSDPDPAPCRSHFTADGDEVGRRISATAAEVATTLKQIARRAPHAKVFVVGYPELVPDGGTACTHVLDLTPGDLAFLHDQEVRLNAMLREQARAAGAVYVDTFTPSRGLNACADPARRWVEPLIPASTGTTLHPNVTGEQGMADAVVRAVRAAG